MQDTKICKITNPNQKREKMKLRSESLHFDLLAEKCKCENIMKIKEIVEFSHFKLIRSQINVYENCISNTQYKMYMSYVLKCMCFTSFDRAERLKERENGKREIFKQNICIF